MRKSQTKIDNRTKTHNEKPFLVNNGFWDRPAEDRSARMDEACRRSGTANFWDLSPEERGRAYDDLDN